ncbi:MAG TPA: hypothetical protein VF980_17965 [Thermoanaerobaculia bacterium]
MKRTTVAAFVFAAALYSFHGFFPGRVLAPADIPNDFTAWKESAAKRVRVSNSLLSDVPLQFIPWDTEARRLLWRREMPWRNRFADDGAPLFANPQAALLSPYTWPRLAIGLRGWAWVVLLKILTAAFGMYWLGRTLGLSQEEATLSGIVFAWSGFATTLSLHPHTNVFVLLPAFCAALQSSSTRAVIATGLLAALLTAGGHPETLFIGVLSVLLYTFLNRPDGLSMKVVAAFAGFLLLAIQVIPFLILLWSSHARVARPAELPPHFRMMSVIGLFLPGALGSPLRSELDLTAMVSNSDNFIGRSGAYIGALALTAVLVVFSRLAAVLRRGVAIGIAGLLLSLWIPGIRDLLRLIPVVNWIAFDFFVIPFVLFMSLAAGPALVALVSDDRRTRIAVLLLIVAVPLIVAGILPTLTPTALQRIARAGIGYLRARGHLHQAPSVYEERFASYIAAAKWTACRRVAVPGVCFLVFAIGLLKRRRVLVYAAAVAELIAFGYGFAPSIRTNEIAREPSILTRVKALDPDRRWLIAASLDSLPSNLGTLYEVRQVDAYDVLMSEPMTRALTRAGYDAFFHGFADRLTSQQLTALSAMGVRFWISDASVTEVPNPISPPPINNRPPLGLGAGITGSIAGAVLLGAVVWQAKRYRLREAFSK